MIGEMDMEMGEGRRIDRVGLVVVESSRATARANLSSETAREQYDSYTAATPRRQMPQDW